MVCRSNTLETSNYGTVHYHKEEYGSNIVDNTIHRVGNSYRMDHTDYGNETNGVAVVHKCNDRCRTGTNE